MPVVAKRRTASTCEILSYCYCQIVRLGVCATRRLRAGMPYSGSCEIYYIDDPSLKVCGEGLRGKEPFKSTGAASQYRPKYLVGCRHSHEYDISTDEEQVRSLPPASLDYPELSDRAGLSRMGSCSLRLLMFSRSGHRNSSAVLIAADLAPDGGLAVVPCHCPVSLRANNTFMDSYLYTGKRNSENQRATATNMHQCWRGKGGKHTTAPYCPSRLMPTPKRKQKRPFREPLPPLVEYRRCPGAKTAHG